MGQWEDDQNVAVRFKIKEKEENVYDGERERERKRLTAGRGGETKQDRLIHVDGWTEGENKRTKERKADARIKRHRKTIKKME